VSRFSLWPQSLFGRLVAASVLAVLLAQMVGLLLIAHERERFVLEQSVREWSRRIIEDTLILQPLSAPERVEATNRLADQYSRLRRRAREQRRLPPGSEPPPGDAAPDGNAGLPGDSSTSRDAPRPPPRPRVALPPPPARERPTMLPIPLSIDIEHPLEQALLGILGTGYRVTVAPAAPGLIVGSKRVIPISPLVTLLTRDDPNRNFDVTVQFPDGDSAVFRLTRPEEGAPLPRNLVLNLVLLVVIMAIALFVTARSITRPLSQLARAADSVGRDVRQPKLEEKGARELRDAARAFNTMQDRLQRYLDSRTRVLAAMSHDLKTPLTRLRLQVETLEDPTAQERIGKQLDEMESMVRGALALFRGLDDDEGLAPVDINALLITLQSEFTQMGGTVTVEGQAQRAFIGKPQALKRCLTNLIENAIKFGAKAKVRIQDGPAILIRVEDEGPGVPPDEVEKVFEPFYRVESSRNRDTGGTGLGLSIARDIAQAHGGTLTLRNLPERGLEAMLTLPRQR
jgi:signal transduction histidine kinase